MTLLDAVTRWRRDTIVAVATFDHGTGEVAERAVVAMRREADARSLPFVHGRAHGLPRTEAAWRAARWDFLRETADALAARVATAHTRDDQLETVFIRALRDAGARGLAGLYASSPIARPMLAVRRADVEAYAKERGLAVVDDPTNLSRRYLRNRVRLDLLPACERAQPGFGDALLDLSARAAELRSRVEALVDGLSPRHEGRSVFVDAGPILSFALPARALLWPEIAARAGIALDRRGTARLAAFTTEGGRPGRVQLAGGHEVVRRARTFEIRPAVRADGEVSV